MSALKSLSRWLDQGISTIDQRIEQLTVELAELKRMRTTLGHLSNGSKPEPNPIRKRGSKSNKTNAEVTRLVTQILRKRDATMSELASMTGENYQRIWAVIRSMQHNNLVAYKKAEGGPSKTTWSLKNGEKRTGQD